MHRYGSSLTVMLFVFEPGTSVRRWPQLSVLVASPTSMTMLGKEQLVLDSPWVVLGRRKKKKNLFPVGKYNIEQHKMQGWCSYGERELLCRNRFTGIDMSCWQIKRAGMAPHMAFEPGTVLRRWPQLQLSVLMASKTSTKSHWWLCLARSYTWPGVCRHWTKLR